MPLYLFIAKMVGILLLAAMIMGGIVPSMVSMDNSIVVAMGLMVFLFSACMLPIMAVNTIKGFLS